MPKVILFSIMWGFFWETLIFDFTGFYLLPVLAAATFLSYSPLIVKAANIVIAGSIVWLMMFFWLLIISNFHIPSFNILMHIFYYAALSLVGASFIYVFEKK